MARTVRDAALLLNFLAGEDPEDPVTGLAAFHQAQDYTAFLNANGLKGKRIGVPRPRFYEDCPASIVARIDEALKAMEALGAEILDPITIPEAPAEESIDVLIYEFKPALNHYLKSVAPHVPVHSLRELIAFNAAHADAALRYGQSLLEASEKTCGTLAEREYIQARLDDLRYARTDGIDRVMAEYRLDALVFPSSWGAGIAAKAGYPSINVPAGFTDEGEPVGITFTARAFEEPKLIEMGYAFEQATRHRRAPSLEKAPAFS